MLLGVRKYKFEFEKERALMNKRFIMKQAHQNTRYLMEYAAREVRKGNTEYSDMDYRIVFAGCLKNLLASNKNIKPVKKAYGSAIITPAQKAKIAEMRNVLGSKWDGTRGSRVNTMSKQQADVEIDRNMALYLEEKKLNFCTVRQYQALIRVKVAKGQGEMKLKRREISRAQAIKWLAQYGIVGGYKAV